MLWTCPVNPALATEPSAPAGLTTGALVDALVAELAELRHRFARVVVVAHSAGGGPVPAALERQPELADHVVSTGTC